MKVNPQCAQGGIPLPAPFVHHLHMVGVTHLRAWREFRGITLVEAAAALGITHGQLSRIERGLQPYNQHILQRSARLYGCSVIDLLTRDPTEGESIFSIWEGLTPEQRRRAQRILNALKDDDV